MFPVGAELVAVAADDCTDPILFDFGPGSDAYFVYTRGRTMPKSADAGKLAHGSHSAAAPTGWPAQARRHRAARRSSEDFGDFEGDPTSINQIPQRPQGTPRGMHPPPMPPQIVRRSSRSAAASPHMLVAAGSRSRPTLGPPHAARDRPPSDAGIGDDRDACPARRCRRSPA